MKLHEPQRPNWRRIIILSVIWLVIAFIVGLLTYIYGPKENVVLFAVGVPSVIYLIVVVMKAPYNI